MRNYNEITLAGQQLADVISTLVRCQDEGTEVKLGVNSYAEGTRLTIQQALPMTACLTETDGRYEWSGDEW